MKEAIIEAEKGAARKEIPVGAVILNTAGEIISRSGNRNIELNDPTAHAEILVIREACEILRNQKLNNCFIYVTLEPCPMCAAAISFARIKRLYFGAYDYRFGSIENGVRLYNPQWINFIPEVYGGIEELRCKELLQKFFLDLRNRC